MFRKFLKMLPKADGKSKLDWQNYWVERSRPLWTDESKAFLNELVLATPKRDYKFLMNFLQKKEIDYKPISI